MNGANLFFRGRCSSRLPVHSQADDLRPREIWRSHLVAADGAEEVQRKALAVFADRLPAVLNEIENSDSPAMARKDALTWLRATISTAH